MRSPFRLMPTAAAVCLLAACGGGGGSPPGSGTPVVTRSDGVAVDGYLQFATVLCDTNGNGVADAGERGAGTSAAGAFGFSPACDAPLVVTGGVNADTGLPFTGRLQAPTGARVVSPLTTLVAQGLAVADVATALGLPAATDLLTVDPAAVVDGALAQPALFRATLAVQQLVQGTAAVLAGLGSPAGDDTVRALYGSVAASMAAALAGASPLSDGTTVDAAVVARVVQRAATEAAALHPPRSTVDPATLAQVVAESLALQASRILQAGASELVGVVAEGQRSTTIADFASDNLAQLAQAPGAGTEALAASLTELVDPYLALAADEIRLVNGASRTAYTLAQFASTEGIRVSWPLAEPLMLELTLARAASFATVPGQKISAAVSITETAAGGQGTILAYIDEVGIERVGSALKLTVPTTANAKVYGVSSDGRRKAVVDFRNSVRNVTGTFDTQGAVTSFPLGNIVNYAINQLSNDFSGIYTLRGRYQVSLVLTGLEMRRADGSRFEAASITVPTAMDSSGTTTASRTVQGRGLTGFVTLVD